MPFMPFMPFVDFLPFLAFLPFFMPFVDFMPFIVFVPTAAFFGCPPILLHFNANLASFISFGVLPVPGSRGSCFNPYRNSTPPVA